MGPGPTTTFDPNGVNAYTISNTAVANMLGAFGQGVSSYWSTHTSFTSVFELGGAAIVGAVFAPEAAAVGAAAIIGTITMGAIGNGIDETINWYNSSGKQTTSPNAVSMGSMDAPDWANVHPTSYKMGTSNASEMRYDIGQVHFSQQQGGTSGHCVVNASWTEATRGFEVRGCDYAWNTFTGGKFNDVMRLEAGNDKGVGNAGNDTIYDGAGADKMYGGKGADTFHFYNDKSADAVYDYDKTDHADGFGAVKSFTQVYDAYSQTEIISVSNGEDSIRLLDAGWDRYTHSLQDAQALATAWHIN